MVAANVICSVLEVQTASLCDTPRMPQCGQQYAYQKRNDRDDHEQFNECERGAGLATGWSLSKLNPPFGWVTLSVTSSQSAAIGSVVRLHWWERMCDFFEPASPTVRPEAHPTERLSQRPRRGRFTQPYGRSALLPHHRNQPE